MDFQFTSQSCSSWLCQGVTATNLYFRWFSLDPLFKVRSIRLVGIVLSMFCLVERAPFLR